MSADLFVAVTVDIGDVEKGLDAMERRARALGPAFAELKKPLKLDQKDHAKKRQGPMSSWAPRAVSTMARLRQGSRRARKLMGRLPSATRYMSDAISVRGVSKASWSGVHMDGGTVGHGSRLPARPFLWISDDLLRIAENTIGGALIRAYGSG